MIAPSTLMEIVRLGKFTVLEGPILILSHSSLLFWALLKLFILLKKVVKLLFYFVMLIKVSSIQIIWQ